MKFRIKILPFLILISLVSVFGYQIYSGFNFYKEQEARLEQDVMIAMKNADFREIYWRIDLIRLEAAVNRKSSSSEIKIDIPRLEDAIDIQNYFLKDLHQSVRQLKKPDFKVYCNLLQTELIDKGIMLETFTELIDIRDGRTIESVPSDISGVERSHYKQYTFPFDVDGIYAYRLNIKQPELFILKKMSGILTASFCLVILVVLSYVYLYKTILRQKTLDEIKSDFVNNMTHELKTPVSVAYAANDALLNYGMMNEPEKRVQYLQIMKQQLSHLTSLIEQILTMSVEERKNLKLNSEKINLSGLFESLKEQYLLSATKNVRIEVDVVPFDLTIESDLIHFRNVIGNLIENSIKYSGENVSIDLSAKISDGKISISVKDNGIGIPSHALSRIFDRFYRVSTGNIHDVKGYGLGLYYVKTIVGKMGGKITVKSTEGKGTEFIITYEN